MRIEADNLDDLLNSVFRKLLRSKGKTNSSKGPAREIVAALLTIKNPRARFSRTGKRATLFSCLGETLWYLSGSDSLEQIEYHISNYRSFSGFTASASIDDGAYGPRLFGTTVPTQIEKIIEILQNKRDTRQAVLQIFDAADLQKPSTNVPCTCTLQFFPRNRTLHMLTSMRSNDAYVGLPHDVFAFTFIQELLARSIGFEVGAYHHSVGSLHLYDHCEAPARQFIEEGFQDEMAMPYMPIGNPWSSVRWLNSFEQSMRLNLAPPSSDGIDAYWLDLSRLLKIRKLLSEHKIRDAIREKNGMQSRAYYDFLRGKERSAGRRAQMNLPGIAKNSN